MRAEEAYRISVEACNKKMPLPDILLAIKKYAEGGNVMLMLSPDEEGGVSDESKEELIKLGYRVIENGRSKIISWDKKSA